MQAQFEDSTTTQIDWPGWHTVLANRAMPQCFSIHVLPVTLPMDDLLSLVTTAAMYNCEIALLRHD